MPDSLSFENHDHTDIRVHEAKLLKGNATSSARVVMVLVVLITSMLYFSGKPFVAIAWFLATSFMVLLTVLYAHYRMPDGIDRTNVYNYLNGHLVLTALTGCTWIAFAIYLIDIESYLTIFITSFFLSSITLGGMMPGAVFRPGFITLASVTLLPFGVFLVFQDDTLIKLLGVGYFAYYLFGAVMSSKNDGTIKEGIKAAVNREVLEEIYEKSREIERLNNEKTQFLTSISHDMSQPLLAQRHFIASLKKFTENPEHQKLLQDIEAAQHNQEQLHRDLVEFNQIKEAKIPVNKEHFDIQVQLDALVSELKALADLKNIKLNSKIPSIELYTDPKLLNRILRNILSNAIKYTQPEGSVEIHCKRYENTIQITVSDNGPGIPSKHLENVFNEYVRLESSSNIEGFGMGLSIVKRLTNIIDGSVKLSTNSSGGTDAIIEIANNAAKTIVSQDEPIKFAPSVLIIGENERREFGGWSNLLSSWNWLSIIASDYAKAIQLLELTSVKPNLVIIDHKNSQFPFKREQDWPLKNVPIVAIGSSANETEEKGIYFVKEPADASELKEFCLNVIKSYI